MGDSPPLTDIRSQFVTSLSYSSTQNQNEMSSNKSRSNSQLPKSQIKSSMSQLLLSESPLTLDEQAILSKSLNKSKRKSVAKNTTTNNNNSNNNDNSNSAPKELGKKSKRRKHKNSKLGCANCKERRVKCLENLPSCTNCIKHRVKCAYLDYTEDQLNEFKKAKILQEQQELQQEQQQEQEQQSDQETNNQQLLKTNKKVLKPKKSRTVPSFSFGRASSNPSVPSVLATGTSTSFTNQELLQQQRQHHSVPNIGTNFNTMALSSSSSSSQASSVVAGDEVVEPLPVPRSNNESRVNLLPEGNDFQILFPAYPDTADFPPTTTPSRFSTPLARSAVSTAFDSKNHQSQSTSSNSLPNALNVPVNFKYTPHPVVDYDARLKELLKVIGPMILKGTLGLSQIRDIYSTWLNSFIYKAFTSDLMFYCLLNLTTNFLITNCFCDSNKYLQNSGSLTPNSRSLQLAHIRTDCTNRSLQYYAYTIKGLGKVLNDESTDPDLTGSVSYILSLMSVYDTQATLNSIICFRNGLFSIFKHNDIAYEKIDPNSKVLIPTHKKLMVNIVMSIYLPGYDSHFLKEYQQLLTRFGELIFPLLHHYNSTNSGAVAPEMVSFVESNYNHLLSFTNDCLNHYISEINNTLSDINSQEELLFQMIYRWVRFFPARLIGSRKKSDPLEKMLYLFYKVFKKALFAIFPQVKFFFLRDFDSPLMLDVFASDNDYDIFVEELEHPINNCLPPELYEPILNELKSMSSYLIRVITYLQLRLNKLYKYLVVDSGIDRMKQIHADILQWGNSISDITKTRNEFKQLLGLEEVCVTSFIDKVIKQENYPSRTGEPKTAKVEHPLGTGTNIIDFMTLQPSGLLINDFDPRQ